MQRGPRQGSGGAPPLGALPGRSMSGCEAMECLRLRGSSRLGASCSQPGMPMGWRNEILSLGWVWGRWIPQHAPHPPHQTDLSPPPRPHGTRPPAPRSAPASTMGQDLHHPPLPPEPTEPPHHPPHTCLRPQSLPLEGRWDSRWLLCPLGGKVAGE